MSRLTVVVAFIASLLGLGSAGSAEAGQITYNLNVISSTGIGSGTLGNVALIQNGPNEVVVAVRLAPNTAFVSTGGPHNAFAFNLDLTTPYTVSITNPSGNIFALASKNVTNTPYGKFTDGIDCPGCGPGASHANPGPLEFTVSDTSGLAVSDFIANSNGFFFSADVLGPAGNTGNIAAEAATVGSVSGNNPAAVPEPASLPLFAGGVVVLGIVLGRRANIVKSAV